MKTDEPTPIPQRASAEPITFPTPASFDERIRRNIYEVLYHLIRSQEKFPIDTMSYREFVSFMERVIAEGDV